MARAASRSVAAARAHLQKTRSRAFDLSLDTAPMEARLTDTLPVGEQWQYEPKWDGFRCLAFKAGDAVELRAKSGKPLARYFPEVVALLRELSAPRFVVDGELLIGIDGVYSFDALQMRLHPAESRIRRLSIEIPAQLMLFDLLIDAGGNRVMDAPLVQRREALEAYAAAQAHDRLCVSRYTRSRRQASRWLEDAAEGTDGVVAKRLDGSYVPGEREMVKVKRVRTADCVVGGFRYAAHGREVGSLLLGLYDRDGKLNHVGYTSSIKTAERAALTRKLEALAAPPGFTGRAPGGPSRWSTTRSGEWQPVRPQLVVEVRFDHVTNERFRHGTGFVRWRPDKAPRQCTMDQIARAR